MSNCPTCQEEINNLTAVKSQLDEELYCSEKCRLEDEENLINEVFKDES